MQTIFGKQGRERAALRERLHREIALRDGNASRRANRIDNLGIRTHLRSRGLAYSVLRIDKHNRRAGNTGGVHPDFDKTADTRGVDADKGIVGADLPDHQLRPAALNCRLQARQRRLGHFAADAGVAHFDLGPAERLEIGSEPRRVGRVFRRSAYALGRRRTDGENVQRLGLVDARKMERNLVCDRWLQASRTSRRQFRGAQRPGEEGDGQYGGRARNIPNSAWNKAVTGAKDVSQSSFRASKKEAAIALSV